MCAKPQRRVQRPGVLDAGWAQQKMSLGHRNFEGTCTNWYIPYN